MFLFENTFFVLSLDVLTEIVDFLKMLTPQTVPTFCLHFHVNLSMSIFFQMRGLESLGAACAQRALLQGDAREARHLMDAAANLMVLLPIMCVSLYLPYVFD